MSVYALDSNIISGDYLPEEAIDIVTTARVFVKTGLPSLIAHFSRLIV